MDGILRHLNFLSIHFFMNDLTIFLINYTFCYRTVAKQTGFTKLLLDNACKIVF